MPPLHFQTMMQVAEKIQAKEISPVEVTEAMLTRIEQVDGRLKSYVTVMAEQAMAGAKQAEAEIVSGTYRGPLHGVPVAVKDLCFTKGVATMGGSQALADHVPDFDGTVVTRLKEAGAVLLGKLNLTEGAMGGYNPTFDVPVNPWHAKRWAGASSSGSGVATAAGLCFGALGSDTGGSIRFPAASCGTVGLKPTWGRVSRYGVLPLAESLDHVGPLTRCVADAGAMLEAISGWDRHDATCLPVAVPNMLEGIGREIKGVRVGFDEHYATCGIDGEVAGAVVQCVKILEELGAQIIDVTLPDMVPYVAVWPTLCSAEAVVAHAATYPARREDYGPWFLAWLEQGAQVTGAEYARANQMRLESNGHLQKAFEAIDVLVCPTMSALPHPVTPEILYGPMPEARPQNFQQFTAPFDFNGAPTLSVPCGLSGSGLPLSVQFVGKHLSEPLLCQVGYAYEQTRDVLHPQV